MTLFQASLFLPYTVNFDSPDCTPASHNEPASLLQQSKRPLPKTPGATTDHENVFQAYVERPFVLGPITPRRKREPKETTNSSPHLTVPSPTASRNPRTIPLSDLRSPSIFPNQYWHQPLSRAKSPPPADVRHYNAQIRERAESVARRTARRKRDRSRTSSAERYTEDNYTIEQTRRGNGGLFNAIDAASEAGLLPEKTWVGTVGMPTDALDEHLKGVISETLEDDYEALAVYAADGDFDGHYEHYCKTILWPIFHYQIPDHPKSKAYEDHSYGYYVKVNQAFADRIIKNHKKGDKVWVHDYHLMLVPSMLREKLPDAEIGFFMHTAFPSSEVFRVLATRKELLEGILGSNMIAFQADEYGHHFIQTCSRILNVEATKQGVVLDNGRFVHVNTIPIGIDPKSLDGMRELPEVTESITEIAEKYAGKRLIVARDKLDSIRGVRQKLLAYELFLNRYPEYREKVVLIQIATSATNDSDQELAALVADIATRINSTYSTLSHQPLVYFRQDIDQNQYLALLSVADCLMITSLREGMNLGAHEWIFCQDGKFNNRSCGPLILSEFTGSASILGNHPVLVNPWDHGQTASAIKTTLDMSQDERKIRWHNMYGIVMNHTAIQWFTSFSEQLKHAWEEHSDRDSTTVPRLSVPNLLKKYQEATKRLLILDYEGTLASLGSPSDIMTTTPKRLADTLNDLIDDNTVYVMSSRMPEELEELFRLVPGLGLIAEDGAFLREAGTDEWLELTDMDRVQKWKSGVKAVLEYYEERVEGSRIEERHSALIFDYTAAAEKSTAAKSAAEAANQINETCSGQDIQAVPIENGLCVSPQDLTKASAASFVFENLQQLVSNEGGSSPDFLLVIGDSREDEYVFSWAIDLEKKGIIPSVHTVTLGARNTSAGATLTQGVTGVISTLRKLAATSLG